MPEETLCESLSATLQCIGFGDEQRSTIVQLRNFETTLYSTRNPGVLGKMKSETGSIPPLKFVGLRAKMYSLFCGAKSQKKVKGIQKRYVKKHLQHQSFLSVLKKLHPNHHCKIPYI